MDIIPVILPKVVLIGVLTTQITVSSGSAVYFVEVFDRFGKPSVVMESHLVALPMFFLWTYMQVLWAREQWRVQDVVANFRLAQDQSSINDE